MAPPEVPHLRSWRTTIVALSLVLLLVTLPVVLFVIKVKPTDAGRLPYGGDEGPDLAAEAEVAGLTMRDALRGSRFYLIALSVFALGISMNPEDAENLNVLLGVLNLNEEDRPRLLRVLRVVCRTRC